MFFRTLSPEHRAIRVGEESPLIGEVVADLKDQRAREHLLPTCSDRHRIEGFPELVGARAAHVSRPLLRSAPQILADFVMSVADSTPKHRCPIRKPDGGLKQAGEGEVVRFD